MKLFGRIKGILAMLKSRANFFLNLGYSIPMAQRTRMTC